MEELQCNTDAFSAVLKPILNTIFSNPSDFPDLGLDDEICRSIISGPPSIKDTAKYDQFFTQSTGPTGLDLLTGYVSYPLTNRLSQTLSYWIMTGKSPVQELPVMFMLNEQAALDKRNERIDELTPKLTSAFSLWDCWSPDEKKYFVVDVIKFLGLRGILDLLGIRQTVGSANILPPAKEHLITSFLQPHSPGSKLTVGARALAKHHHRDDSLSWWGNCTGTEDDKNKNALNVLLKVMANATWINIHTLPHEVRVIEMRTIEGYGVRWFVKDYEFRGFLEPQMEDGHAVGWKH